MRNQLHTLILLFTVALSTWSCNDRVYEKMLDLDSGSWNENNELTFEVEIENPQEAYDLWYLVRYTADYPYYNLYLNRVIEDSTGKVLDKKLQVMDLFDASSGMPFGAGMGSMKDYPIYSVKNYKFPYAGKYKIKLKQYMRQENLTGIYAVGFRVSPAEKK